MQKQNVAVVSCELTAALDRLNYISQMLQELAKMVPARAGERLPEILREMHLELTEAAARLLAEHLNELGQAFEQSKMSMQRKVS